VKAFLLTLALLALLAWGLWSLMTLGASQVRVLSEVGAPLASAPATIAP
jgi:hypothetical protein